MRILHCPTTVGGNPQEISRHERALGYESCSIALVQNYLNYPVDEVIFKGSGYSFFNEIRRWKSVARSLRNYDVIHYNFGQSLCPMRIGKKSNPMKNILIFFYNNLYARWLEMVDVKWAHKMNKIVAVTFQGDDARQGDYCAANYPIHFCHEIGAEYYNNDDHKRERIRKFDRYADLIYAVNPDLLNVLPGRAKFIPYANINIKEWTPIQTTTIPKIIHVVHAPSNRLVKGTSYIIDAFDKLQSEGIQFRYTLVENLSNAEARKIYETADLLVDQLLAGFYGGLSVELMALGKPVICYMREEDMHHLPDGMRSAMPIINAMPDSIYMVLKEWLTTKKSELAEQGRISREYVEIWHDPRKIAAGIIEDYKAVASRKAYDAVKS